MANKVLVVDDSVELCNIINHVLTAKGIEVRAAGNGNAGISLFQDFHPDVVLLDYRLPDMNGNDVARTLKAMPGGNILTIITMTGTDMNEEEQDPAL